MMAMEVTITEKGSAYEEVVGNEEEMAALQKSYEHVAAMRDECISLGIIPAISEWSTLNPNLK